MNKNATTIRIYPLAATAALLLAIAALVPAQLAWASGQPGGAWLEDLSGSITVSTKASKADDVRWYSSSKSPKTKIANARSSNRKVATVKAENHDGYYSLKVQTKKPGTTTISYTLGGKKKSVKYTVVKYANPVTSFKVGGKDYASSFAPKAAKKGYVIEIVPGYIKAKTVAGKVNVKTAKGWKIQKMWYWAGKPETAKMKYFKNGQSVRKATAIYAWLQKGTQRERLALYCSD